MKLKWIGARGRGALALPEGWPGEDHDEPDAETAKAKVESGSYARVTRGKASETAQDGAEAPEEG